MPEEINRRVTDELADPLFVTAPEGVAVAFKNGMDLICGDYRNNLTTDADNIVKAVKSGLTSGAVLDRSVRRLMEARIRLGMFDPATVSPYTRITAKDYDTAAHHAKSTVRCEALILDDISQSDTYPYIEVEDETAALGHEATASKVGDDQLFYLMSRGLSEAEATAMIVNGFIEPITRELPMEYAVELNRLIELQMEGSVG